MHSRSNTRKNYCTFGSFDSMDNKITTSSRLYSNANNIDNQQMNQSQQMNYNPAVGVAESDLKQPSHPHSHHFGPPQHTPNRSHMPGQPPPRPRGQGMNQGPKPNPGMMGPPPSKTPRPIQPGQQPYLESITPRKPPPMMQQMQGRIPREPPSVNYNQNPNSFTITNPEVGVKLF